MIPIVLQHQLLALAKHLNPVQRGGFLRKVVLRLDDLALTEAVGGSNPSSRTSSHHPRFLQELLLKEGNASAFPPRHDLERVGVLHDFS